MNPTFCLHIWKKGQPCQSLSLIIYLQGNCPQVLSLGRFSADHQRTDEGLQWYRRLSAWTNGAEEVRAGSDQTQQIMTLQMPLNKETCIIKKRLKRNLSDVSGILNS